MKAQSVPPIHIKNGPKMTEEPQPNAARHTDDDAGQTLWRSCLEQLAQDLPVQQFNTWIVPITAQLSGDASRMTLYVANRFTLDWVRAQYLGRIAALLQELQGDQPIALDFKR